MSAADGQPDWAPALAEGTDLATGIEQAALLEGALASGFLRRCRTPVTISELAAATGLAEPVTEAVCAALRAMTVLTEGPDGRVTVSDFHAPLLVGGIDRRILDRLASAAVRAGILRRLFDADAASYWTLDAESRLAIAAAATGDARTQWARERLLESKRDLPDWHEALAGGGRFLDLGCGVGGAICAFLVDDPEMTAVGVDRAEDLLEVARARARELGIDDRATFVAADAAEYLDPDGFDVVFWPQIFYPQSTRGAALASAFANLRPGGLLLTAEPPPSRESATAAVDALVRAMWGIEPVSSEELRHELRAAGFVDVTHPRSIGIMLPYVTARRPG